MANKKQGTINGYKKPHKDCDLACMITCTEGFVVKPKCEYTDIQKASLESSKIFLSSEGVKELSNLTSEINNYEKH